jgi:hypothetical protein
MQVGYNDDVCTAMFGCRAPAYARRFQGQTGAAKAEVTHNYAEGASMAQEVIMYSNVGCGPCHQPWCISRRKVCPL